MKKILIISVALIGLSFYAYADTIEVKSITTAEIKSATSAEVKSASGEAALSITNIISPTTEVKTATVEVKTASIEVKTASLEVKAATPEAVKIIVPAQAGTEPAAAIPVPALGINMSIKEIINVGVFPLGLSAGAELYNFKYYNPAGESEKGPEGEGWYQIVENGTMILKSDSQSKEKPYCIFLGASAAPLRYKMSPTESGQQKNDYLEVVKTEIDSLINLNKDRYKSVFPVNGVGDVCIQAEGDASTVYAARGPFIFMITVTPYIRIANWSKWSINEGFKLEEKTTLSTSPELINTRVFFWRGMASSAAQQLMRDYIARFDEWYFATVAKGNGIKGYYWPDMSFFLPDKGELPEKMSVEGKLSQEAANPAGAVYKSGKSEKYKAAILAKYPQESDEKIDSALEAAKTLYKTKAGKKPGALTIAGADEACRVNEKVIFRRDNIVVEVLSTGKDFKPKPQTIKLAEKIAQKIAEAGTK